MEGSKINVVPDRCSGEIDVRIPAGMTARDIKAKILGILDQFEDLEYDYETLIETNPNYTSPNEMIFQYLQQNVKDVADLALKALYATGFTDGKHFRQHGIPTVTYGPGEVSQIHAYNEYVHEKDVLTIAEVLALTSVDYLSLTETK